MGKKRKDDDEGMPSADAWMTWIQTVPQDEREEVGRILAASDTSSPAGLSQLLLMLIVHSVGGKIHPLTVASVKPLISMMLANTWMMHSRGNTPQMAGHTAIQMIEEIRDRARLEVKPLTATYSSLREADLVDVIDADEDDELTVVGG